jgi:RNA polymerase sigma-70 factor (ECF subfamily)
MTDRASPPEDAALLTAIAERDAGALADLHDRHAPLLLALVRRVLGSEDDAEEIVQETFLQVWRQAPRYDPERASVSTWLVLIARSRAIDRARSRGVRARTEDSLALEPTPADRSADQVAAVLANERRLRVRHALGGLPAEQRTVLEMAYFDGLTQREIAEHTGTPLGTVKTRTLLAMKKLRDELRAEIAELL